MDELAGCMIAVFLFAVGATALVMFAMYLPIIGLAIGLIVLPGVIYYAHVNSAEYKEKGVKAQTEALYRQAAALAPPDAEKLIDRLNWDVPELAQAALAISAIEGYARPKEPPLVCNTVEGARYRDKLHRYIEKANALEDHDDFLNALFACLPKYKKSDGMFEASAELTNEDVEKLILPFYEHDRFFHNLRQKLERNFREQDNVLPSKYKGEHCAYAYLKDTPLILLASIPQRVSLKNLTSHMWVLAGTGHGKTSLVKYMIAKQLDEDCTIVVMDSHRQLIDELAHLDLPIDDVTYLSPHNDLGINLFDVDYKNLRKDEGAVTNAVELLEYVLGSLMEAELTSKQQVVFQFAIQLTAAADGNIDTFLEILKPKGWVEYADVLDDMPAYVQEFFHDQFDNENQYGTTKQEVSRRVWGMLKNPTFARIFFAKENPINMADELANAKLILIDTDQSLLGENGSSFFGRMFIAMVLQTARQRFTGKHRPVYFYIDEAPPYFDSRLERMLREARKANIGLILLHQDLADARRHDVLAALTGNTAIKFAGDVSDNDARYMAGNMRTDYQFIKEQDPLHFAAYVQGEGVYSISVPLGALHDRPKRYSLDGLISVMEEEYGNNRADEDGDDEPPPDDDEDIKPGKL
ncbi:helicase HerA domain-containing protein [Hoeflea poritis]|uniref:DUF87 domain-containing protein n=1 Tax=Hoeflea poritis TaxID=2993659 RepID=A0ABT4VNY9_9HYPH|nr:DUF87 domain-containing protein [Hoeflea poritis]MDA4846417.1 DUF87 domain-containing protein [Hoeflea poritis]